MVLEKGLSSQKKAIQILTLLSLVLPLFVGAFLGLYQIEAAEAHVDSGIAPTVMTFSWRRLIWDFFDPGEPDGPEDNYGGMYPPLYYVSVKAFGSVFGGTEPEMRYFSFGAQILLILLAWLSFPLFVRGKRPWLRLLLTLAVASAPAHIWWAQVTKYIHFYTLLQALSLVAGVAFLRKQTAIRAGLVAVSLLALAYTHYMSFLFAAASYLALGLILLKRKAWRALRQIVLSGVIFTLCVAPLFFVILPSHAKLQNRGGFPNLYTDQPAYQPLAVFRDFFVEFNFGPSLTLQPGAFSQLPAALRLGASGQFQLAWRTALPFLPLVLGIVLLGGAIIFALWQLNKSAAGQKQAAVYLVLVPGLFMVFSPLAGYVIYFPYIGVGTFCTFLLLVMGWSYVKDSQRLWTTFFAVGIFLVFTFSLTTYYRHQDLKYPRVRPAVQLLVEQPEIYQRAIITKWMANENNLRLETGPLPENAEILIAADPFDLDLAELTQPGTVVFLVGPWSELQSQIETLQLSYQLIDSWIGLEKGNAQIHAVVFMNDH